MAPQFDDVHKRFTVLENMQQYPLLCHAVQYWPLYLGRPANEPGDYLDGKAKEIVQMFFKTGHMTNGGNFTFWVGMLIPDAPMDHVLNTKPLYYAASFGLVEVVRLLLDTDKDIKVDELGGRAHSSALHVATYRDHIEIVKLLLDRGADPNVPNIADESALEWATRNGNPEMIDLLLQHGARPLPQPQQRVIEDEVRCGMRRRRKKRRRRQNWTTWTLNLGFWNRYCTEHLTEWTNTQPKASRRVEGINTFCLDYFRSTILSLLIGYLKIKLFPVLDKKAAC